MPCRPVRLTPRGQLALDIAMATLTVLCAAVLLLGFVKFVIWVGPIAARVGAWMGA